MKKSHLLKIKNNKQVAEIFREFFSNIVKSLNISQNPFLIFRTSQTDPALQSIEKFFQTTKYHKH